MDDAAMMDGIPPMDDTPPMEDGVRVLGAQTLHQGFLRIDKVALEIAGIDGPFTREVMVRGPAACVLLYDQAIDSVLLVEEFRIGNFVAGLPPRHCWSVGPVAGMIEPGSTPAETARREAAEEAGFDASDILLHGPFTTLPSPGGMGEIIHHFVAFCDLSHMVDGAQHGLASEHESTTVRIVPRAEAMAMLVGPIPANGLLSTCLLHLDRLLRA